MATVEVFVVAWFSLLLLGAGAFYRLMSEIWATHRENREDNQMTLEEIRREAQERRADTQRLLEAIFNPPTQAPQAN